MTAPIERGPARQIADGATSPTVRNGKRPPASSKPIRVGDRRQSASGRNGSSALPHAGVTLLNLSEHELLRAAVTGSPTALVVADLNGIALLWNPASERLFGWSAAEVIGRPLQSIEFSSREEILARTLSSASVVEHETQRRHRDGRLIDVAISTVSLRDPGGRTVAVLRIFRDIRERKKIEAELLSLARHDELTGLLNWRGLREAMSELSARHDGAIGAMAAFNLRRLPDVTDLFGLAAKDEVLRTFARRMARGARPSDLVARLDGAIFALAMPETAVGNIEATVARVLGRLGSRYSVGGRAWIGQVTVGVAICSDWGVPDELIRRASDALHQARLGPPGRIQVIPAEFDLAFEARVELADQLAGATDRGELRLDFQPIVSVASGRITSVEALVRWEHPNQGLLGPDQFISLAEETGSISEIGGWVLQQACRTLADWTADDPAAAELSVSVNLSTVQLLDPGLVAQVAKAITDYGLAPDQVCLEVTESVLSTDPEGATVMLDRLHALGVGLAIDDFGTGNSSLTALQRFPFQVLKIDRSFVSGIRVRPQDSTIVAATLALAHGLGVTVVAEGVETMEQVDFLTRNGCEELQGYLLGRPAPSSEILGLLSRRLLPERHAPQGENSRRPGQYRNVIHAADLADQPVMVSLGLALRPILEELQERTGLESVYLTRIDWEGAEQEILIAANRGDLIIPEGLVIAWSDTLCRRSLEAGQPWASNVPDVWPDSTAARDLGIVTYASVPVTLSSQVVYGTLCGASRRHVPEDPAVMALMGMVARMIAALVVGQRDQPKGSPQGRRSRNGPRQHHDVLSPP
ncbi:MAG TPA: EAL domain-containing protein [Candidatus Micrarchaeaceae archaeon]|nr:EAL domain-containing protein [Candidatus Micrarchaeaceae archaeon]